MKFLSFSIITIIFFSVTEIFSPNNAKRGKSNTTSICTCQFETPRKKNNYSREMTRFFFVVEESNSQACCESDLKKGTLAFKETHKMTRSCPVWALVKVDTLSPTSARELSCSFADGIFAIYPIEKMKDSPNPTKLRYYPDLID